MKLKEAFILLPFLFVFIHSLHAQNQKPDSISSCKSEYNGIDVSNSNWIHKNDLDARIEWIFKNDSTFIRTKIWPEDGPKYDVGKYKIDKRNKTLSIQWGFSFLNGNTKNISYSDPQLYTITKWTEKEIILRKQVVKEEKTDDSLKENNSINLIRSQLEAEGND